MKIEVCYTWNTLDLIINLEVFPYDEGYDYGDFAIEFDYTFTTPCNTDHIAHMIKTMLLDGLYFEDRIMEALQEDEGFDDAVCEMINDNMESELYDRNEYLYQQWKDARHENI